MAQYHLVTRRACGWVPAAPVYYDSEAEALRDLPAVADALQRPVSTIHVVERRISAHQYSPVS